MATIEYLSAEDVQLATYTWEPKTKPKAIVLVLHGQAEHSSRYHSFAECLSSLGCIVKAHDHRGHGKTSPPKQHGHFADKDGWQRCIDDVLMHQQYIQQQHPNVPFLIFGQGMGSFMAQEYMIRHSNTLDGVILSGTSGQPDFSTRIVRFLSYLECIRLGKKGRSAFIQKVINKEFNKLFHPIQSPFDWRCRQKSSVRDFIADPTCGFLCSPQMWLDIFDGMKQATLPYRQKMIRQDIPIFIIGGSHDPVGMQAGGVKKLLHQYRMIDLSNVTYAVFPNCRHDLIHEKNSNEVYESIALFIDRVVK